ncbi:hypothetical protein N9H95_03780 [Gammaproteobacteria bacterium]|nr:hypothetical protein [Gammaproteobacteria bacterium]
MRSEKLIEATLLLLATGMPGLSKIIILLTLEKSLDINVLGNFSNSFYAIQFLLVFTALGFAGRILAAVPIIKNIEKQKYLVKTINSFILLSITITPLILILYLLGSLSNLTSTFILMVFMGIQMIIRHYFMALKDYRSIFIIDSFLIIIYLVLFYYLNDIYISISLAYLCPALLLSLRLFKKYEFKLLDADNVKESFNISINNFFSGGVYLLVIPVASFSIGVMYGAFFALIHAIINSLFLISNALGIYFIPSLSKANDNRVRFNKILKYFSLVNTIVLIFFAIACFILYLILSELLLVEIFLLEDAFYLYMLFYFALMSSKTTLPIASAFISKGLSHKMIKINICLSLSYLFVLIISYYVLPGMLAMFIFLSSIILGNFLKLFVIGYMYNSIR